MTTRIGPRQQDFLRRVAAANDAGVTVPQSFLIDATAPKRTQGSQRQIIGEMIRRGLLEILNTPATAEEFFSFASRSNAYALRITEFGRECLAAIDGEVAGGD